ncbi:hypothetical protein A0U89_14820 (plasmid) [Kozakia baliensis]|uniref:Uncharacterized protein n=1 Tax=Kozakia baliensis TaxID=153496 RepID=A0A1D8UXX7_9PROT|nr:hypothetical protein [Kozakia baliensis]AOX18558.1 hypothetical protein A0U89_14820 [Kozakia baliensis]
MSEYTVFALLFRDGSAYVGCSKQYLQRARTLVRHFADDCLIVTLDRFTPVGGETRSRREVYAWRYRLCRRGARLRSETRGEFYRIGRGQLHAGIARAAMKMPLPPQVAGWARQTSLFRLVGLYHDLRATLRERGAELRLRLVIQAIRRRAGY